MSALVVQDNILDFISSYLFLGGPVYPAKKYKKWFGFLYVAKGPKETIDWKVGMTNYIKDRTKALAREKVKPPVYVWSCPNVQVVETAVKQVLVHFTAAGSDDKEQEKLEELADEDNGAETKSKYRSEIFYLPFPVLIRMIRLIVLYVYTREQWIESAFHFQTLDQYFQIKPEGIKYINEDGEVRIQTGKKIINTNVTVKYPTEEELRIKWQRKQIKGNTTTTGISKDQLKKALEERGIEVTPNPVKKELLIALMLIVFEEVKDDENAEETFEDITGIEYPVPEENELSRYAKTLYIRKPEYYGKTYRGIVRRKTENNRYDILFIETNTLSVVFPEYVYPINTFDVEKVYNELGIDIQPVFPEEEFINLDPNIFDDIAMDIEEEKEEELRLKF
tara:strand:- start:1696 stop:2874 length:1179 start_codon:yes stop_codon:yes gene_type:complete